MIIWSSSPAFDGGKHGMVNNLMNKVLAVPAIVLVSFEGSW